eukprot:c25902_g1_i1 orf=3-185(-)
MASLDTHVVRLASISSLVTRNSLETPNFLHFPVSMFQQFPFPKQFMPISIYAYSKVVSSPP